MNLPPSSNAPTPERARELDIRSLTLNGLDVQYEDQFRNWGVKVPRIESELLNTALGAKGNFGVRGNLVVPPARAHDDDGAVRDGDDVRRLEREARTGAAVVVRRSKRS